MDKKSAIRARRAHIIEAALACFLEKGFNQTGIRDIARRAEISLGNLYNHFPSKKSVLIEIAALEQEEMEVFLSLLAQHEDPRQTLRKFLTQYTEYCCQSDYVTLAIEVIGEAIRDKEISDLFAANHDRLTGSLAGLLNAGAEKGHFKSQTDMKEIAAILLDSIEGYGTRKALGMRLPAKNEQILHDFLLSSISL